MVCMVSGPQRLKFKQLLLHLNQLPLHGKTRCGHWSQLATHPHFASCGCPGTKVIARGVFSNFSKYLKDMVEEQLFFQILN